MLDIAYEDQYIIAVHKRAGVATQTAKVYEKDIVSHVSSYMMEQNGNASIGLINRLDQPVEGIVLFGKNKKTTSVLSQMLTEGKITKHYYAAVYLNKEDIEDSGKLVNYLLKDSKTNSSRIVDDKTTGAKRAVLEYKLFKVLNNNYSEFFASEKSNIYLADIHLITGRHHQIRVQMSGAGMPLLGDVKYANEDIVRLSKDMGIKNVALCAYSLAFLHPVTKEAINIEITPNGEWYKLFSDSI